jgi:hypothetical protein
MPNATVIAASLDSAELEQSINKLVETVKAKTNEMAKGFTEQVSQMEQSLKNLGNYNFGGSGGKAASSMEDLEVKAKRANQAIKELTPTLDQQAKAMQQAVAPKQSTAAESYHTFVKNMRENVALLAMEIKNIPSWSLDKQFNAYMQYERQIEQVRNRIAELRQQMQEMANDPSASRLVKKQTLEEISSLESQIVTLEREQITTTKQIAENDKNVLAQKQAQYERERQELISLSAGERERITFVQQQNALLDNQLQKVNDIATKKQATEAFISIAAMPTNTIDEANAKMQALQALMDKVRNTPLMSTSNVKQLQEQIYATTRAIWDLQRTSEDSSEKTRAAAESVIQTEKERREEIMKTAQTARATTQEIIELMHKQASDLKSQNPLGVVADEKGNPVNRLWELREAIEQMNRAYFAMSNEEKQSAVGQALAKDIKRAQDAIILVRRYNEELFAAQHGKNTSMLSNNSSVNSLQESLKKLVARYNNLTVAQINAGKDKQIVQHFQDVSRAAELLRKNLSRPINFEAANNIQVRTLDDMVYKMKQLQSYRQGIDLTKPNADNEIKKVDIAIENLQKDLDKYMATGKRVGEMNNALARSWNYMKNRLAFYFTVGASTQFVKTLIDIRAQYEMNERALGILIGSAERGTQVFRELSEMALVSPYTLIELSSAAKQLTAYDIAAKDVVDTTRRLADMASAVGVPMERLTYALGQIKAYGYLNSRDARMFANAGIPLVKALSDHYTELEGKMVSVGDVYDRMKKKAIDFNDVMAVVTKMTDEGGKFFDFQAKMADTLKVRLANLTLAWNNMLNDMGQETQGVLTTFIGSLKTLFLHWKDIDGALKKVIWAFGIWKAAQAIGLIYIGELNTKMGAQILLGKKLGTTLAGTAAATKSFISGYTVAASALLLIIGDIIVTSQRNAAELERLNKAIIDGAKESAEALEKTLSSSEMVAVKRSAAVGKLSQADAGKAWESLREQIELSAMSNKQLIDQLLLEPDLNKRVAESFTLAESIQAANQKLSELDNALDVTHDSILFGAFGEGLAEDIEDYNERLKASAETEELYLGKSRGLWTDVGTALTGFFSDMKEKLGSSSEEAEEEMRNFAHNTAETIRETLGEEGLKDSVQINEAVMRALSAVEATFPQIKGKGKALFEEIYYDIMSTEFAGAIDKQTYYYNLFLTQLKKDHASAFGDVTDEILDDTHTWSEAQIKAIRDTADKIKADLPAASQDAINQILNQLNSTEFKVRIVAELATNSLDEVQKQFREKFITKDSLGREYSSQQQAINLQKYGSLMRKENENNLEYEKRISEEKQKHIDLAAKNAAIIDKNKNKQDAYSRAIVRDAENQKKASDEWVAAANKVSEMGGYDFTSKQERADAKKSANAAKKAQKDAETELQKALKEEIGLIDKVRSAYKSLTEVGVDRVEAITQSTSGFEESVMSVNKVLTKYGIGELDLAKFAGVTNPTQLVNMLETQLENLMKSGKVRPAEIKDLQVKIKDLKLDATSFNYKKITDSLNNQLSKIKEEYELSVELNANPEFSDLFIDTFGINTDALPKNAKEYADEYLKAVNKYLDEKDTGIELPTMSLTDDDLKWYEDLVKQEKLTQEAFEVIKKGVSEVRATYKKEFSQISSEWQKLYEKYAEYEYKMEMLQKKYESERKTAIDKGADVGILMAIENMKNREQARIGFEEFQKTAYWVTATGNLSTLTTDALQMLIDKIEGYKRTAKDLTPKQIEKLNKALVNLRKQVRTNDPFSAFKNSMEEARLAMAPFEQEIQDYSDKMAIIMAQISVTGIITDDDLKLIYEYIQNIKELEQAEREASKVSFMQINKDMGTYLDKAKEITSSFQTIAEAIGNEGLTKAAKAADDVVGNMQAAQKGAESWGGWWGAIIGGLTDGIPKLIKWFDGDNGISKKVQESEILVRRLENAYKSLERQIEKSYGASELGARRAAIANKELQLAETERQLQLELSRKKKNQDEEKILDLQSKIQDLKYEIEDAVNDITNSMLGISDIGDAAENLVTAMIDSFRQGEDYMAKYDESFENMIDNMVMKSIVSKVIGQRIEEMWAKIQSVTEARGKSSKEEIDRLTKKHNDLMNYQSWLEQYDQESYVKLGKDQIYLVKDLMAQAKRDIDVTKKELEDAEQKYTDAMKPTPQDVETIRGDAENWRDSVKKEFDAYMDAFGIMFGQDGTKALSALQQGIQGITEDTAGALEAYMNGVSQQVYLQSDLLTQIRDAVVAFDIDVQVATVGQILLQLQASYQVQMSIQSTLQGWSTPNGMGVRVEMM